MSHRSRAQSLHGTYGPFLDSSAEGPIGCQSDFGHLQGAVERSVRALAGRARVNMACRSCLLQNIHTQKI